MKSKSHHWYFRSIIADQTPSMLWSVGGVGTVSTSTTRLPCRSKAAGGARRAWRFWPRRSHRAGTGAVPILSGRHRSPRASVGWRASDVPQAAVLPRSALCAIAARDPVRRSSAPWHRSFGGPLLRAVRAAEGDKREGGLRYGASIAVAPECIERDGIAFVRKWKKH